jgi:hypothetical protein
MAETFIDKDGYRKFSDSGKLVHQWVAEKELGYKPGSGQVVHHKNRNKQDNSPENLAVLSSQKIHDKIHKKDAKKYGKKFSYKGKVKKTKRH